jgi:IclR family transcriptional regulator, acetate operon repressor
MAKDTPPSARRNGGQSGDARRGAQGGDSRMVRTLATGMAMLGMFDAEHRSWTLDEMVARLGVSRMTAYRMARTLQGTGHLVSDPTVGGYRLGPAMLAGIYLAEGFEQLVTVARPYLERLMKETGELAALAVELDGVAVCADLVASARPFVPEIAVGRVIGDTANAHGKMFAAMKPEAERARIVKRPHRQLTTSTITDPVDLAAEFERIRSEGMAFDFEEHDLGTCAVVAPVRNQTGELIATMGVVVPTGRFSPEARVACARAVREAAVSLSEYCGYARADRVDRIT